MLISVSGDPAKRPDQVNASFAYHYCKLVMSHFGMFSWEQRCVCVCVCARVYVCMYVCNVYMCVYVCVYLVCVVSACVCA